MRLAQPARLRVQHRERHQQQHQTASDTKRGQARPDQREQRLADERRNRKYCKDRQRDKARERPALGVSTRSREREKKRYREKRVDDRRERNDETQVLVRRSEPVHAAILSGTPGASRSGRDRRALHFDRFDHREAGRFQGGDNRTKIPGVKADDDLLLLVAAVRLFIVPSDRI